MESAATRACRTVDGVMTGRLRFHVNTTNEILTTIPVNMVPNVLNILTSNANDFVKILFAPGIPCQYPVNNLGI